MLKCLHGGPSVMMSITPIYKLTANYQFNVVKDAAATVEKAGLNVMDRSQITTKLTNITANCLAELMTSRPDILLMTHACGISYLTLFICLNASATTG